jgi:hypothetical protein
MTKNPTHEHKVVSTSPAMRGDPNGRDCEFCECGANRLVNKDGTREPWMTGYDLGFRAGKYALENHGGVLYERGAYDLSKNIEDDWDRQYLKGFKDAKGAKS